MDRLFTFMLIILLSCYAGLRVWGNDTVTYLQMYAMAETVPEFFVLDNYNLADGWGFGLMTCLLKDLGFSSQDYLMFFSFLTVTPYVLFIRRYCPHFTFGIFLLFATGMYTFTMAAVKQCAATGICLVAIMAALEKKWIRYLLLMVLAFLFHPYSMIYLIVPLMMFKPWTKWTYIYIVIFIAAGFTLESLLGTVLEVTDLLGADYTEESFAGEGVNILRVAVAFVPMILSIPYQRMLFRDADKTEYLMFNLSTVHALVMFVGLFGTANYFARLANYLLPAIVVTLPWMLNKVYYRHRLALKSACLVGYTGFFTYEHMILRSFDLEYSQITIWQYIADHF
ncbi:MAG: EpsG family protein [Clostridia bacterium]|nr:EpsG family protein [Clostridia bacterium]